MRGQRTREIRPHSPQLKKNPPSNKDPAQSKKKKNFKKISMKEESLLLSTGDLLILFNLTIT